MARRIHDNYLNVPIIEHLKAREDDAFNSVHLVRKRGKFVIRDTGQNPILELSIHLLALATAVPPTLFPTHDYTNSVHAAELIPLSLYLVSI